MRSSFIFWTIVSYIGLTRAYLVDPPTTASNDTITDCSNWVVVASTDSCQGIADDNFITLAQFDTYNPSVSSTCILVIGNSYCVEEDFGIPPPTTTSSQPSSTENGVSTPSPIQTGMVSNCNSFYLVQPGDQCTVIASNHGISLQTFYSYNPAVGSTCAFLIAGDYVCVSVLGGTTLTTTTTPGNGIVTPTPIQSGMVGNCNSFYLVASGDQCATIASSHGISLTNFDAWNPLINSECSNLIAGDYVCIGAVGFTTTKTTTTSGNGISTPEPIQTGMVKNCNTFYLVKSGDQCATIASSHGISLANFDAWNPAINSDCTNLIAGDYVCVNIIGGTTTTAKPTTTTKGNGITTPTPTQSGMVSNCNSFYLVKSGDQCATIASSHGISLAQFLAYNKELNSGCTNLIAGDYYCVNIVGGTTSTSKKPTTTTGNGIATPTPTQTGMVKNCKKFHLVVSGDQCGTIASSAGITLANFYAWNPAVGTTCASLWLGYYVCIGLI
ncbi:hypothetical protein F5884DRAFT_843633 [Xylogone sp. PMI_703]|nr:hypothetical protein F5884DRAFT_843633 [Xylogone sp. PMI_703]